jgi:hypothetical protein
VDRKRSIFPARVSSAWLQISFFVIIPWFMLHQPETSHMSGDQGTQAMKQWGQNFVITVLVYEILGMFIAMILSRRSRQR